MSEIMMKLGDYKFSVSTAAYQSLQRVHNWRWKLQERINRKPAQQFLGPGEETIDLDGTIYPHFKGGLGQVNAMRAEADKGEPLILVDGLGVVWGKYCIKRIAESQTHLTQYGAARKIGFQMSLVEYGEDK